MTQVAQLAQLEQKSLGNTKRLQKSRGWVLTINNYTPEELDLLTILNGTPTQYIWGEEIGEKCGTPHIQGFLYFKNARSFNSIKKMFPRARIEKAKGSPQQNLTYCSKDMKFITNIKKKQSKEEFKNSIDQQILNQEYKNIEWKKWQQEILNIIEKKPDPRKIYWYWEPEGNVGKSYLCKYISMKKNTIIGEGKMGDVFNQINNMMDRQNIPEVVLIDIPRCSIGYVNYATIEKIKNGCLYSGKYEGGICRFPHPHVFVFANEEPDYDKLSEDRFIVKKIENEKNEKKTENC